MKVAIQHIVTTITLTAAVASLVMPAAVQAQSTSAAAIANSKHRCKGRVRTISWYHHKQRACIVDFEHGGGNNTPPSGWVEGHAIGLQRPKGTRNPGWYNVINHYACSMRSGKCIYWGWRNRDN